jgi:hypothetical protein
MSSFPRSPNDPDADHEPTERPPPGPRPESPFEAFAKQAGRALLRSGVKALARGAGAAVESAVEDGDRVLEGADAILDRIKEKIASARRGPPR